MVPKVWAHSDIYCQLIPNEDDNQPYYEVVPRIGTFEVSVNGVVSTFLRGFLDYWRIALFTMSEWSADVHQSISYTFAAILTELSKHEYSSYFIFSVAYLL
jgi:hypothetical protein